MAKKKRASASENGENSPSVRDGSESERKRRKISYNFGVDAQAAEELELMREEALHRRKIEERRVALDEERLTEATAARKEEQELRRLGHKEQKALVEASAAIADRLK